MEKLNCWEFLKCGRELGGPNVTELGVCPASTERRMDGVNFGKMGGRACWVVAGTLGGKKVLGSYAAKLATCASCEFYKKVIEEEGENYQSSSHILKRLNDTEVND